MRPHPTELKQPMFTRYISPIFGVVLLTIVASTSVAADRPNIVIILADDLGYGSLNSYGAEETHIRTPNIDRLATSGRRFTDANTPSSVCSPTRYGLLTGRYDWRTDQKHGVLNTTDPLHIETSRSTIASLLKSAGYRTAAIGKWHLGDQPDADRRVTVAGSRARATGGRRAAERAHPHRAATPRSTTSRSSKGRRSTRQRRTVWSWSSTWPGTSTCRPVTRSVSPPTGAGRR